MQRFLSITVMVLTLCAPMARAQDGLAVGVPYEDLDGVIDAGAVDVLYGKAGGLTSTGSQFWHQDSPGIPGQIEEGDTLGFSLTSGDFNGDGKPDLVIGVGGEEIDGQDFAGLVHVLYSDATGTLVADDNDRWYQGHNGLDETPESGDLFGEILTTGDFDGDGYDDLAIGAPGEDVGTITYAGMVHVLYGSAEGLVATDAQTWTQDSPNVDGSCEEYDTFGGALTAGDFNGDGYDDLAIGVPGEDHNANGNVNGGAINVLYGTAYGLSAASDVLLYDPVEQDDAFFGRALAAGDINGDGFDELAVGTPAKDSFVWENNGTVFVFDGAATGLAADEGVLLIQGEPLNGFIEDVPADDDEYGSSLAMGDYNRDGFADLAVGIPGEDADSVIDAGAVNVLYGTATGLTGSDDQFWHQNAPGIISTADPGDSFGESVAAGDFNGDGYDDLAIGVPAEGLSGMEWVGAVNVIYGSVAGLGDVGNQFWSQSGGVPDGYEDYDAFGASLTVLSFDSLFRDSFESGDMVYWSATVP